MKVRGQIALAAPRDSYVRDIRAAVPLRRPPQDLRLHKRACSPPSVKSASLDSCSVRRCFLPSYLALA